LSRVTDDTYMQLLNWKNIARRVKDIIHRIDPAAKIYVFGSVVKGRITGASDIDILVITNNIDRKYDMMVAVYREIEAPVELHIVTPEKFMGWYKRFIDEENLVEI
jgi:predicted nucleotidyltransferase